MRNILFIFLLLFSANLFAAEVSPKFELLGGITGVSNDSSEKTVGVIGSVWLENEVVSPGIESVALSWGQGLFLSGSIPIHDFNLIGGIGGMGYKVNSPRGYYAKEPAATVALTYKFTDVEFVARFFITKTEKDYNGFGGNIICEHNGLPDPDRDNCSLVGSKSDASISSVRRAFLIGLRIPLK